MALEAGFPVMGIPGPTYDLMMACILMVVFIMDD